MKSLYKNIVVSFVLLLGIGSFVSAQRYRASKAIHPSRVDNTILHYGYSVGVGVFDYRIVNSGFERENGLLVEQVNFSPALRLGVIGEWNLTDYSSLRTIPGLYIGKRTITYRNANIASEDRLGTAKPDVDTKPNAEPNTPPTTTDAEIKSIYADIPILFKYRGVRINNYNFYLLGGFSYHMDLTPHKKIDPTKNRIIRTNRHDFALEFGGGMDFYLRYFKMGVELRISLGLTDVLNHQLVEDSPNYHGYTKAIESMKSTLVTLAFNFE